MLEILRTNDPVELSWAMALLADAAIAAVVLDTHTSVLEGSIGVLPRRVMVGDYDADWARRVLDDAGLEPSGVKG